MGARKSRMMRKIRKQINFHYNPTFRAMMQSYRFWMRYVKRHKIKLTNK